MTSEIICQKYRTLHMQQTQAEQWYNDYTSFYFIRQVSKFIQPTPNVVALVIIQSREGKSMTSRGTVGIAESCAFLDQLLLQNTVGTVSFRLVRTRISIVQRGDFPQILQFLALLGSGVPPPAYRSIQIVMLIMLCNGQCLFIVCYFNQDFVCGDGGSER
jgi:hypothetical protein